MEGRNFNLPKNWKWVKSSSVIDVRDGTHDTPKYFPSGIPLVTSKNLVNGGIDFQNVSFISEEDHIQISKRSKVERGDILLAMIGTIGNPVLVETDEEFSIKNVALFKFADSKVNARFFYHLLNSDVINQQLSTATRGGTQKFVSLKVLRSLEIPLPPLAEQKRIARILDVAAALQAQRRATLTHLDTLLQSTFLHMFGDPVTNQRNWPKQLLSELVAIDAPMVDPTLDKYKCLPHIGADKIERDTGRLLPANTAEEDRQISGKFLFDDNHVLYGKIRPYLRKVALPSFIGLCSADVYPIRPIEELLNREMLYQILLSTSFTRFTDKHSGRANIPKINREQLLSFECIVPPLAMQARFKRIFDKLETQRKTLEQNLERVEGMFQSLQQRAFRGELSPG